jgi:LmbE family N-acetylglucosaminyl deacetylase
LGVFTHPDDEVFCAGGWLAKCRDAEARLSRTDSSSQDQDGRAIVATTCIKVSAYVALKAWRESLEATSAARGNVKVRPFALTRSSPVS